MTDGAGRPPVPRHQFASLMPVTVTDYMHYQFYEICPPACLFVAYPLPVRAFDQASAEEALARLPGALKFLGKRGVDRITLAGLPVAASLGRERCLELTQSAHEEAGIPFAFDAEETLEALRHLGARRVAIAAKWPPAVMDSIAAYLRHGGFDVPGYSSGTFTASEVTGVTPQGGAELALRLGEEALDAYPDADALLLGGGAWLSLPAILGLEDRYGKPVVSNTVASCWAALRQVGLAGRTPGLGRLINSLSESRA